MFFTLKNSSMGLREARPEQPDADNANNYVPPGNNGTAARPKVVAVSSQKKAAPKVYSMRKNDPKQVPLLGQPNVRTV